MTQSQSRNLINVLAGLFLIATVVLTVYWYRLGVFSDLEHLQTYLLTLGVAGPLLFVLIQIIQVVIPIIPGGISTAAGVLLFGPWAGFVYNYVGIVIGSFFNFFLARRYGRNFIRYVVADATFEKYMAKTANQSKFDWFFAIAIVAPIAPDDVLCLVAGLTNMTWRRFSAIIILGKPFTIAAYSWALMTGAEWLLKLFG